MNQAPFQRPEDLPATFGRYRVLKRLGQGGMGAVYLATDTQLDRPVALKIPHFDANDGSQVLERFQREARAAATILHPNVCPLHEVGEIDGVPYLTMGYIEGKPLSAFVAAKPLQPRQCALLVRKLALALAEAHKRGVIHRDLKPANIMIDRRSEPIIMDFGLARRARAGDPRLTQLGTTMGTPAYMPPEQVNGDIDAMGPASDIYSLGVILYELLTGRLPFSGDAMALLSQVLLDEPPPPSQFRPNLDPELEAICLKAMAKKIPDRYASMTDLAVALQGYLRTKNPAAEPLSPIVPSAQTPTPAATAATMKPGFKPKPAFGSPEERDAFLAAPTLKPGVKVRDQGELRPLAAKVADTPPNMPPEKTGLASRLTATVGGVPLWVWIAGAAAAVVPVMVVVLLLMLLFTKPPDTRVTQVSPSTKPEPTDPTPPEPPEPGTIAFKPSEPAAGVEVKVDGVAAPSWGEPLQLSAGEHDLEA